MVSDRAVRLDLVAGFRGAGKTTLLSRLAVAGLWPGERVLLLLNEQGKTRPDPRALGENCFLEEWRGGCICCAAAARLEQALLELVDRYRPDRIVLELAETGRIGDVRSVFESSGAARVETEHVIWVLRAGSFDRRWELSGAFAARQLADCPAVWLTGWEEADPALLDRIREAVAGCSPRCALVPEEEGALAELYARSRVYRRLPLGRGDTTRRGPGSFFTGKLP